MILENLKTAGVQQAEKADKINFTSLTPWPGHYVCAEGRYIEGQGRESFSNGEDDASPSSDDAAANEDGKKTPDPLQTERRAGVFILSLIHI